MRLVDLFGNGCLVPVCDKCLKGDHNTNLGHSHVTEDEDRSDCKEVSDYVVLPDGFMKHTRRLGQGSPSQCCCGMGGTVYKPKETEK